MKVVVVFGSLSDKPIIEKATKVLKEFEVDYKAFCISAHRLSDVLENKLKEWEKINVDLIIAGAGLAAHLPGVIASKTIIPVIGIPINNGALKGLDALFSIVQMPPDIPVATIGIDNAKNAAILAIEILSIKYPIYKEKLLHYRKEIKEKLSSQIQQDL